MSLLEPFVNFDIMNYGHWILLVLYAFLLVGMFGIAIFISGGGGDE